MTFSYKKLLQDNAVKESDLPESIQQAINTLHELEYDLDDEDTDQEIAAIKQDLGKLDKEICTLIVEQLDDESDEDWTPNEGLVSGPPAQEIKRNLVHTIWQAGLRVVKIAELKKHGYPVPAGSKWNEKVGEYTLKKNLYEETVHICKA